jgi:hypothetical protein
VADVARSRSYPAAMTAVLLMVDVQADMLLPPHVNF